MSKSAKKVNRTLRILGRLVIDIRRQQAGATFTKPVYPDDETLRKMGLAAIGELHDETVLTVVKEAARRDSGVKALVNQVLNRMIDKAEAKDLEEEIVFEQPLEALTPEQLADLKTQFQEAVARHDALPESDFDGRLKAIDEAHQILVSIPDEETRRILTDSIPEYVDPAGTEEV